MRWPLVMAALLGASSVILGAFLKHAVVSAEFDTLQTALRYHQIHGVVLLVLGMHALNHKPQRAFIASICLFMIGTVIFSGSLYVMVLYDMPQLGKLTPVGGILLILGWLSLAFVKQVKKG